MLKINVLLFSCGRDESMMMDSIDCLRKNFAPNRIIVANDLNDPIQNKVDGIEYVDKAKSTEKLYGLHNIAEMIRIYKLVSEDCDYLQKLDSDTVTCSDYAYKRLFENRWDAYGSFPMANPAMIPKGHFAGPSYFLKSDLVKDLNADEWPRDVHDWAWMNYPEDMVISHLCNKITSNIQVDGTAMHEQGKYLFDTYLTKVVTETKESISQYGFAHCRTTPRVVNYLKTKLYDEK